MIKYSYANCNGVPVHINNVTEQSRQESTYTCICCGEAMAAHIKGKRKKHFQHYKNVEHNYETYLHLTAKKIIKESYINAVHNNQPVYIEYYEKRLCNNYKPITSKACDLGKCTNKFDITRTHKEIYEEHPVGQFIPDLHLKSANHKEIFIEVFVTHRCDDEKVNSGYKIIEVRIKDEDDLQGLFNLEFLRKNKNIKFYGFETKSVFAHFCGDDGCKMFYCYYVIYIGHGRYELGYDKLGYIMSNIRFYDSDKYLLREHKEEDDNYSEEAILNGLIWEMRNNFKLELKTCHECINYQGREFTGRAGEPLRCKKLNKAIEITDAINCNSYEIRQRRL